MPVQEALYRRYCDKMFGVLLRYADSRASAEDWLQDGFVKVFENISRFSGKGSLEGWIRRIMVNTALEALRKRVHQVSFSDLTAAESLSDTSEDVLSGMSAEEILLELHKLPAGYRTVFNLYVIEGFNHREIAAALGITEGTSKSQLARAKAMLRKQLQHLIPAAYERI